MSLKWKKITGGFEAEVKNADPKKRVSYIVKKRLFLGMKTSSFDVSKTVGYTSGYVDIATKVSSVEAAKAVAETDYKKH